MKKICFITGSMGRGGAERVISILTKEYSKLGWNVEIIMLLHSFCEYPLDKNVKVVDLSYEEVGNPILRKIKMLLALRKHIKEENPNVVVPFHAKIAALSEIAFWGMRKEFRVVTSERIDPYSVDYPRMLRFLIRRAFSHADAIVFQSKRAQSFYSQKIQEKSKIIGNPVSIQVQRAEKVHSVIINAGRLENQKNQRLLIYAFSEIARQFQDYELHIYGEGSLRKELEELVLKLGLQQQIKLMGNCVDYQSKLALAEVFVLSSDFEGLSNALLEAMMLGMPCISTSCAGSEEVICSGDNGLLVPIGDVHALSEAMKTLLSNEGLKKVLSKRAKESASQFKTEKVLSEWRAILENKNE